MRESLRIISAEATMRNSFMEVWLPATLAQCALELGATAIIAIDIDYTSVRLASGGDLLMISVSGTAVTLK